MSRNCRTCQHLKRPEIDRRLAAGEPVAQVARDHEMNPSSLHRHKTNCLKLGSSNEIKKEAARGSAAVALLPSKENLGGAYADLQRRIDEIVTQAQQQGSLNVAISGLNSIRQTLDSLARLAGHLQPAGTQVNVAVQTNINVGAVDHHVAAAPRTQARQMRQHDADHFIEQCVGVLAPDKLALLLHQAQLQHFGLDPDVIGVGLRARRPLMLPSAGA